VCATFAIELYLKCILVDAGAKTIPKKHNLLFLFQQIPKATRGGIIRQWRAVLKKWKSLDASVDLKSDLESTLTHIADAFDKWCYRFEFVASELNDAKFTRIHARTYPKTRFSISIGYEAPCVHAAQLANRDLVTLVLG
jgi:hypothetical protein